MNGALYHRSSLLEMTGYVHDYMTIYDYMGLRVRSPEPIEPPSIDIHTANLAKRYGIQLMKFSFQDFQVGTFENPAFGKSNISRCLRSHAETSDMTMSSFCIAVLIPHFLSDVFTSKLKKKHLRLLEFIEDESQPLENRKWIWQHYGTAYRATYTMYLSCSHMGPFLGDARHFLIDS